MKVLPTLFSLVLALFLNFSCFTQENNKNEEQQVIEVCKKHLKAISLLSLDSANAEDKLRAVTLPNYVECITKKHQYYTIIHGARRPYDVEVKKFIKNDSAVGCEIEIEGYKEYIWLDVLEREGKYKVSGINGEIITNADVKYWDSLLSTAEVLLLERESIKSSVRGFISGMNEMYQSGNSDKFKTIAAPNTYEFYNLCYKMDSIKDFKRRIYTIEEIEYIQIHGDSAHCYVRLNRNSSMGLNLEKQQNGWVVLGENEEGVTEELLDRLRLRLKEYQVKLDILKHKEVLDSAFRSFMIENDSVLLRQLTSNSCFEFFKKFKICSGDYNPKMLAIYGMRIGSFLESSIELSNDTATIKSLATSFHFLYQDNTWILHGIGEKYDDSLDIEHVYTQFEKIKRSFRFHYSVYNLFSDDALIESIGYDSSKDTTIYHRFYDFNPPPKFKEGELYNYLKKEFKQDSTFQDIIYVSFVIEKDGSLTHVKIHKSSNSNKNAEALRIIQNLPNWAPGKEFGDIVRCNLIIGIPF